MNINKKCVIAAFACILPLAAFAQIEGNTDINTDSNTDNKTTVKAFRHLDLSITAGTTGLGIDIATPICKEVQIRAGFSFMPHISTKMHFGIESGRFDEDGNWVTTNLDNMIDKLESFTGYRVDKTIDMIGIPTFYNFNLLVDVFPFHNKHWHFTGGFYLGPSKIAKAYNTTADMPSLLAVSIYNNIYDKIVNYEPIIGDYYLDPDYEDKILEYGRMGIHMGDYSDGTPYFMVPGDNSMVKAKIRANSFKPYVGFGYGGRLIPKEDKFMVSFDCGAMFWGGTPEIITHDGTNLAKDVVNIRGKVGDYVDVISKFKVYPVINVRFSWRIF
ncbi:MAG: hypothetical protein LUD48_01170 [Prevotella sp.]|nr:hypothetical protein [Prevotella sp.]